MGNIKVSYLEEMTPQELALAALALALGLYNGATKDQVTTLVNLLTLTTENLSAMLEQSQGEAEVSTL